MSTLKFGFASFFFVCFTSTTQAQQHPVPGYDFNGYPGGYSNYGVGGGVYGISISGFGNYGLPGKAPSYDGYALSGYGPAASANSYFGHAPPVTSSTSSAINAEKSKLTPRPTQPAKKTSSTKTATSKIGQTRGRQGK